MQWTWRVVDETHTGTPALIRILNQRMTKLAGVLTDVTPSIGTFTDGATTPSVAGASIWIAQNTAATSITGFKDGEPGQTKRVWSTTANTTFVHSASLRMKGGVNVTMTATETRAFATVDSLNWREI